MRPRKIGIVCYPLIGGSGILATELGHELAMRGHTVHFFSYAAPVRLELNRERIHFHPVEVGDYGVFPHPDYTLPLAVRMAEVGRSEGIELFHVHYAVPHATAAFLAREMLAPAFRPAIVTTLHGTDTTLLGCDPIYQRAIEHALAQSDAVTTVSHALKQQTLATFALPAEKVQVVHNFFEASAPTRDPGEVRRTLGVAADHCLILHMSNLRPVKRVDLLLRVLAASRRRDQLRLVILAGGDFQPYEGLVKELGIQEVVRVVENAGDVENYLQAADVGLYTSEAESFGLSILESMFYGLPVLAYRVGGIAEVVEDGVTGLLHPFGDITAMAADLDRLADNRASARTLGREGRKRAESRFTAAQIVPQYEALYEEVLSTVPSP